MADIDPQIVAIIAIAGAALSVVLAAVVLALALRLRTIRQVQRRAFGGQDIDIIERLEQQGARLDELAASSDELRTSTGHLRELVRGTVSRMAVVRYDAFDDMGGALSFSAAMLDENGHGVVISAINGRQETRCYAKGIISGRSENSLTHEEADAIGAALGGTPPGDSAPDGGRRRRRKAAS